MKPVQMLSQIAAAAVTLAVCTPSAVLAYGRDDAISDCESRLRSDYGLSDFRHDSAEKLPGEDHQYRVSGETKIKGDKYPFECYIRDRHVVSVNYQGPESEKTGTAEKLAIGAAAAAAVGLIAHELSKDDEKKGEGTTTGKYSTTEYDATTSLRCSLNEPSHDRNCAAGILRGASGSATIRVTTPVGYERTLHFAHGDVSTPDGGRLDWGKQGDEWYIGIDNREFYIVPDAAIYGG